ncbi:MAG: hypothetical protein Q9195_001250 [Heterodermia aff. obscurata]
MSHDIPILYVLELTATHHIGMYFLGFNSLSSQSEERYVAIGNSVVRLGAMEMRQITSIGRYKAVRCSENEKQAMGTSYRMKGSMWGELCPAAQRHESLRYSQTRVYMLEVEWWPSIPHSEREATAETNVAAPCTTNDGCSVVRDFPDHDGEWTSNIKYIRKKKKYNLDGQERCKLGYGIREDRAAVRALTPRQQSLKAIASRARRICMKGGCYRSSHEYETGKLGHCSDRMNKAS